MDQGSTSGFLAVANHHTLLGTPWKRGGARRDGADCWGVVQMVYELSGVDPPVLPAEAVAAARDCRVSFDALRAMDGTSLRQLEDGEPFRALDIVVSSHDDNVHVAVVVVPSRGLALTSHPRLGCYACRVAEIAGYIGTWRVPE